jgi:cytochrome c-type biogenesis protein CcmF
VENASFMPWLTGTAFLHSVMMQEKRGMMKVWNVWLIFVTFLLSILGTFLTRSGVVSSVHAFAQSSIGYWFWYFLLFSLAVCLFFFIKNRKHLKSENKLESLVSRESSFLFNNVLFLVACFAILWGTLFPILSEKVQGVKVTVGPPFFNRVNIPIFLFLLLLTGVGPLLAWRKTSVASLKRNFTIPVLAALAVAVILIAGGVRPWRDVATLYSFVGISLAVLVAVTVASEFLRGARVIRGHTGQSLAGAMLHLTQRNTRRYGGYLVHFGIVVIAIGVGGAAFNQEKEQELGNGDKMSIGAYTLVCRSYTQDDNATYSSEWAILDVFKGDRQIATMYPERRFYKASEQASTMVANRSTLEEDLYLVYAGKNNQTDRPIIKAHINPLVSWLWIGVWVMVFGTLVALAPNAEPVRATQPARVRTAAAEAGD